MKKIIVIITILILIGVGAYFIIFKNNYNTTPNVLPSSMEQLPLVSTPVSTPETSTSNNTTAPVSTDVTINIKNFSFDPKVINIKSGTKVTWINNDSVAHTITSDSGDLLKSPILTPGQSFSFTFTDPGSANYHCSIHTSMKGSIVIATN